MELTILAWVMVIVFMALIMTKKLSPFTALIIVPLVFATGAGAGARHSMGTGVFGGMIAATFIATIWLFRQRKSRKCMPCLFCRN